MSEHKNIKHIKILTRLFTNQHAVITNFLWLCSKITKIIKHRSANRGKKLKNSTQNFLIYLFLFLILPV